MKEKDQEFEFLKRVLNLNKKINTKLSFSKLKEIESQSVREIKVKDEQIKNITIELQM